MNRIRALTKLTKLTKSYGGWHTTLHCSKNANILCKFSLQIFLTRSLRFDVLLYLRI